MSLLDPRALSPLAVPAGDSTRAESHRMRTPPPQHLSQTAATS